MVEKIASEFGNTNFHAVGYSVQDHFQLFGWKPALYSFIQVKTTHMKFAHPCLVWHFEKNMLWNLSNKFACDYFERPENDIKTKARESSQTSLWWLLYKQHLSFFVPLCFLVLWFKGRDTRAVTGFDSNSFTYNTPRLSFLFTFSCEDLLNVFFFMLLHLQSRLQQILITASH